MRSITLDCYHYIRYTPTTYEYLIYEYQVILGTPSVPNNTFNSIDSVWNSIEENKKDTPTSNTVIYSLFYNKVCRKNTAIPNRGSIF